MYMCYLVEGVSTPSGTQHTKHVQRRATHRPESSGILSHHNDMLLLKVNSPRSFPSWHNSEGYFPCLTTFLTWVQRHYVQCLEIATGIHWGSQASRPTAVRTGRVHATIPSGKLLLSHPMRTAQTPFKGPMCG